MSQTTTLLGAMSRAMRFSREAWEKLEVYTANRLPLEHVFGVDLIYLNVTRQSIVMLQYKMLERDGRQEGGKDWIYRPDTQLDSEIGRMRQFSIQHAPGRSEYRLNPQVFHLKFVKRGGALKDAAIITPLDHFERLRTDPDCRGPRGGVRISFNGLAGRYLRQTAFLDLLRSGYIGAHARRRHISRSWWRLWRGAGAIKQLSRPFSRKGMMPKLILRSLIPWRISIDKFGSEEGSSVCSVENLGEVLREELFTWVINQQSNGRTQPGIQ